MSLSKCIRLILVFGRYNASEHPIPFYKSQGLGKAPKKLAASGPLPDLEEAMDVSALFRARCERMEVSLFPG